MTDREENAKLKKIIYVLAFIVFLLVVGFVAYLSYGLTKLNNVVSDNISDTSTNTAVIKQLKDRVTKIESQAKIPGPKGDTGKAGKDGKDSVSTNTVEQTTVIEKVPVNGKDGKDGAPGRELELGKDELGNIVWRYIGTKLWNKLEAVQ